MVKAMIRIWLRLGDALFFWINPILLSSSTVNDFFYGRLYVINAFLERSPMLL